MKLVSELADIFGSDVSLNSIHEERVKLWIEGDAAQRTVVDPNDVCLVLWNTFVDDW